MKLFCGGVGAEHPDFTNASRQIKKSELDACAKAGVAQVTEIKVGYRRHRGRQQQGRPEDERDHPAALAGAGEGGAAGRQARRQSLQALERDRPSLPNEPIEVLGPPPTSGTRDAFVELVMDVGCEESPEVKALSGDAKTAACHTIREDGVYVEAGENDNLIVQKLTGNPNAFGIFGYSFLDQNVDKLQGSSIAGIEPTYENIADGKYPVSRSLFIYAKNAHVNVIPGMREFIAEYTSDAAMGEEGYLADKGLIPLPADELKKVQSEANQLTPLSM